jgi:PAS domain S-box-containing protein
MNNRQKMKEAPESKPSDLRKRAEETAATLMSNMDTLSPAETQKLFHELQVHQIELEMQNEELRATQAELEAARSLYFDLYNLAPIGYFTISEKGLILAANLTGAQLLGVSRTDLISNPISNFILPEDQDIYYVHRKQLFETGTPQTAELRFLRKDSDAVWVRIDATLVRDAENKPLCRTVLSDITELKKNEETLQKTYAEIDMRVLDRTAELKKINHQYLQEIEQHKKAEESLLESLNEVKELKNQLKQENIYLKEEINLIHSHKDIVGNSEAIRSVFKQIEQVAPTDSTVLIQGETGSGKELLAHSIHNFSSRKGRLMVKVNCAALPPTLIESELFGREKGAFTGSLSKQIGRFELAHESTIFLDEIDSLPLELQAKLLRVLESGEFERLGSPKTVKVDVRIISATNRDLAIAVKEGEFREDLYYRLNVFQITVPPLRERQEDILPLLWSFVQEFSTRMGKRIESIPQKDVEALQAYTWPGNVRELKNVTERAMIITTGPVLHFDIPKIEQLAIEPSGTLDEVDKRRIIEALNSTGWRVSGKDGAAEILGINPKTLESRMQKLGIHRNKKLT